jgi:hypothetical protein
MKTTIKTIAFVAILAMSFSACKKDKKTEPTPETPTPPVNEAEVITTLRLSVFDGTTTVKYQFKDPDGDGGIVGAYGNLSNTLTAQSDSVINLSINKTYTVSVLLLDETKAVADTISNAVLTEGIDHMFFFNSLNPTGNPYSVYLTGSMTTITYLDLDANLRGIGLLSKWQSPSMVMAKSTITVSLRHQPGVKNGTYAPGDSDIEIPFKLKIN